MNNNYHGYGDGALLNESSTLTDLIYNVMDVMRLIVPLLIGAAIVVFLWGVLVFIAKSSAGNAEGRREGINFMIFGIIGIAVMVSVWGLVAFVTNTLGSGDSSVPQLNGSGLMNSGYQTRRASPSADLDFSI